MSSAAKACGPAIVEKWIAVPDINSHCVNEVAKLAVNQFNKKYENNLKFEKLYEGWFLEVAPRKLKYKLHIKALDFLGRLLNFEAFVHEEKTPTEKIRVLISLTVIVTIGHFVGPVKPPLELKWIKIPDIRYPFIETVAKFLVDEHNKKYGDSLRYESVYEGWYAELGQDDIKLKLHIKAKDCLGRVQNYEGIARVEKIFTERIKTFISFHIIENWIKIPDVQQQCVKVVVTFALDWILSKYGVKLELEVIYDGWYLELGPSSVKFRLRIKAIDILGRLLDYEIIVVQEILPSGGITRSFILITILSTPKPTPGTWLPVPSFPSIKFLIEIAKWALEKIRIETGDNLFYDIVSEISYSVVGGDDIEFRLIIKVKDCIGRVFVYQVIVIIKQFTTVRVRVFKSFQCITIKN